jgi:ethanolamine utilization protein EutQ
MCGGLNFLNEVSVPWELTCDEIIYCMEGTFRLTCDGVAYECNPGDVLYIPKTIRLLMSVMRNALFFMRPTPMIGSNKLALLLSLALIQRICHKTSESI